MHAGTGNTSQLASPLTLNSIYQQMEIKTTMQGPGLQLHCDLLIGIFGLDLTQRSYGYQGQKSGTKKKTITCLQQQLEAYKDSAHTDDTH